MFKKIDHVGIAVKDLGGALSLYKAVYGLEPLKTEAVDDLSITIAFIPVGEVLIELLEPTQPGAGRIGRHIEENGEGFHHIAFEVNGIDEVLARLKTYGIGLRDETPRKGAGGSRIAFIDPSFTNDVLTELVEPDSKEGGKDEH